MHQGDAANGYNKLQEIDWQATIQYLYKNVFSSKGFLKKIEAFRS